MRKSISIGIPAYNEANNIRELIYSLRNQNYGSDYLKEIIIISDSSTDDTVKEIKKIKDKRIILKLNGKRIGQALSQNKIINTYKGDVLVLLNADVLPANNNSIRNLYLPIFKNNNIGIVSADFIPVKPKTFFESVLHHAIKFKRFMYERYNNGDNLYLCGGGARAFSKNFLKRFKWPRIINEDSYSYFFCKNLGLKFYYCSKSKITFKLPDNFNDYKKQSKRYIAGNCELSKYFDNEMISKSYKVPLKHLIIGSIIYFIKNPFYFTSYLIFMTSVRLMKISRISPIWEISSSSKKLK
jgi:cellulose synthase/poly-beta-1,6-N-acetylglucosamine synthase-like glycosyltransferase